MLARGLLFDRAMDGRSPYLSLVFSAVALCGSFATFLAGVSVVAAPADSASIPDVPMSHYFVTQAERHAYIETSGVSTCVVITFYDPQSHVGILAHVAAGDDVAVLMGRVASEFRRRGIQSDRVQGRLIGGWKGWSESIVNSLASGLKRLGVRKVKKDVLTDVGIAYQPFENLMQLTPIHGTQDVRAIRSVMLGLRDGAVYDYVENVSYVPVSDERASPIPSLWEENK